MNRNGLLQAKKEVDQGREQLIKNLERKVDSLKLERELLRKKEELERAQQQVVREVPETAVQPWQLKQSIQENRQRGFELQSLYRKKKELESIGVQGINPKHIDKAHQIATKVFQNDKDGQRKRKIIDEEMQKAKQLLGRNKAPKRSEPSEQLTFEWMINNKSGDIEGRRYRNVLKKEKLSKMDQEYLLEGVFKALQTENEFVNKEILQQTLPHNQRFCEHFCITKRQIRHDLEVCKCQNPEGLSYREYYQFIKSIQLTSQPKYKAKPTSAITPHKQPTHRTEKMFSAELKDKYLRDYLKHVFELVDKKQEFVVLRSSLATAIEKGSYMGKEFQGKVDKGFLKDFGRHFQQAGSIESEYYKRLSKEYVSYNEAIREYQWFLQHYNLPAQPVVKKFEPQTLLEQDNTEKMSESDGANESSEYLFEDKQQQIPPSPTFQQAIPTEPIGEPIISVEETKQHMQTFDRHYKQLSQQYRHEIAKDEFEREQIKQQLSNLENYISYLQHKQPRH